MTLLDERGLPHGAVLRPHLEIAPREFDARRRRGDAIRLVDCRTDAERELATIDGAEHVPMDRVAEWIEDLLRQELTDRRSGDALDDLSQDEPAGDRVIREAAPRPRGGFGVAE